MKRPSRYYVPYEDRALLQQAIARVLRDNPGIANPEEVTEPHDYWRNRDFDDFRAAKRFAAAHGSDVWERVNIHEDPPGMWDWDERLVS